MTKAETQFQMSGNIKNKTINVMLAGNPNCGKTTLFNQLTGSSQYVGNWPGVTVEKKSGRVRGKTGIDIKVVDLPGIYSLSPYTPEEIITRNCVLNDSPDVIINIIDASNIERNLYLTTQLAELAKPIVIALNMYDILEKNGDKIDIDLLEKQLDIPIVPISASKNIGIDKLIKKVIELNNKSTYINVKNIYSYEIDRTLNKIENELNINTCCRRWTAVKLFEGDSVTWERCNFTKEQKNRILAHLNQIQTSKNFDREMLIADERYKYICSITKNTVFRKHPADYITISDKIDNVIANRFFAIPFFLFLMLAVFTVTFGTPGTLLRNGAEYFINNILGATIQKFLIAVGASYTAQSLVIDGMIAGVGSVISFLPQILLLFTLLSLLEDSGYMSRAAFIMDKPLRFIGLSGRAFVPMLMGFGCTVPAVLAARTLENQKDKRLTILITPFMSCSAKMPVYLLFISYFFANKGPLIIFAVYLLGIAVGVLTALFFKSTILKGENAPFVMELPPYRLPSPKSMSLHVWNRLKEFLVRAGTVLLGASVIIWFLQSFNFSIKMVSADESMLASIGKIISPVFSVCGFGDWRAAVSLLTGIAAKESIVSTLSVLYTDAGFASAFTPLSAFSFIVFVLLYTPCIAAVSAIYKEMGSTKWTLVSVFYQLFAAWLASALVFQIGTLIINLGMI